MRMAVVCVTVLVMAMSADPEVYRLRILHTNDLHSRFDEVSQTAGKCSKREADNKKCYGGFARLQGAIKQEIEKAKKENVSILSLNAGDTYQGTVWFAVHKWKIVARFMEMLTIDAMSFGNHEFDDGISGLLPFLNASKIPILAANVDFSGEPEMKWAPLRKTLTFEKGGRKIGIIGYITPESVSLSNTGRLKFKNQFEVLRDEAARLKKEGIDIIIAVGHSGYDNDIMFAKQVPDLDVIVGGHSHTFLYTGKPPDSEIPTDVYPVLVSTGPGEMVATVQAYAYSKYLGKVDLWFDKNGRLTKAEGNPILLNHEIPQDPAVLKEFETWSKSLNSSMREQIGKSNVFLDGSSCRFSECNLGNLITDAYIHYGIHKSGNSSFFSGIAIQQGGGIRATINPAASNGLVTREDFIMAMPFFGTVSLVKIKGKHLLEALEWSVARYDPNHRVDRGEFLQVSGMKVKYDIKKPPRGRVVSARVKCTDEHIPYYEDINLDKTYQIIMPTFILKGGDNFIVFKEKAQTVLKYDLKDTEIVMHYVKQQKVLTDGLNDRIEILGVVKNSKLPPGVEFSKRILKAQASILKNLDDGVSHVSPRRSPARSQLQSHPSAVLHSHIQLSRPGLRNRSRHRGKQTLVRLSGSRTGDFLHRNQAKAEEAHLRHPGGLSRVDHSGANRPGQLHIQKRLRKFSQRCKRKLWKPGWCLKSQ